MSVLGAVAVLVGLAIVALVVADVINTLVATTTSRGRLWPTVLFYSRSWGLTRRLGLRLSGARKMRVYGLFAPLTVIGMLLIWVILQVVGFGLIWWGLDGVDGAESLGDALYYSGVVYFTLGFGEIVPEETVPRVGALVEAFVGVLTTALVIGYLPSLYGAYSEREQQLLKLDDGTEGRITPTNLVLARAPDGDPRRLDGFFAEWEAWVAHVMETHTTFRMLVFFRSQHIGQSWVTALGVVLDAALHVELMQGGRGGPSYWLIRRGTRLLHELTDGADLSAQIAEFQDSRADAEDRFVRPLYAALEAHGFPMYPLDDCYERMTALRAGYAPHMEYLIEVLDAPRGFWGHSVGHRLESPLFIAPE